MDRYDVRVATPRNGTPGMGASDLFARHFNTLDDVCPAVVNGLNVGNEPTVVAASDGDVSNCDARRDARVSARVPFEGSTRPFGERRSLGRE